MTLGPRSGHTLPGLTDRVEPGAREPAHDEPGALGDHPRAARSGRAESGVRLAATATTVPMPVDAEPDACAAAPAHHTVPAHESYDELAARLDAIAARARHWEQTHEARPSMLPAGTIFHRYLVLRAVGRGGTATVYETVQIDRRRRVALKLLHGPLAADAQMRRRLVREGAAVSRIRHPHVVELHEVGVHENTPYLAMEYLDGENLADLLARAAPLPVDYAVALVLPIVSAVAAIHAAGVVHRDLKPDNVLLARTSEAHAVMPKLLDFGVSRLLDGEGAARLTGGGAMMGTPYYMAPEHVSGEAEADARSDQYALGVMLYECVAGRGPFDDVGGFSFLPAVAEGRYAPPSFYRAEIPLGLEAAILRAMRRAPATRFASVRALGRALLMFAPDDVAAAWEPVFADPSAAQTG